MLVKLLVTGGAGYTGSVVTHRLRGAGHRVEGVDDLSAGFAAGIPDGTGFRQIPVHAISVHGVPVSGVAAVLTPRPGRLPAPDLTGIAADGRTFHCAAR